MKLVLPLMALLLAGCFVPDNGSSTDYNPAIVVCVLAICEQEDADQSGSSNEVKQVEGAKADLKVTPI